MYVGGYTHPVKYPNQALKQAKRTLFSYLILPHSLRNL